MVLELLFNLICYLMTESQLPHVIVSGLIIGIFALTGVLLSFLLTFLGQYLLNRWRNQKMIRGVVQAIYEELYTIYIQIDQIQQGDMWKELEEREKSDESLNKDKDPKDEPYFALHFPVPRDYLIIYRSNANLIGQINKHPMLPSEIVSIYMLLQAIMEHLSINNDLMDQHEKTGDEKFLSKLQILAPGILIECKNFMKSVKVLFYIFNKKYKIRISTM